MGDKLSEMMLLHTLTPTHAGSGTEFSYVDLPVQRESHTGFPKIEASTLKGCIRCAVANMGDRTECGEGEDDERGENMINRIFGDPGKGDFASAVALADARLLFFPVKSAIGVFAWITCPFVIRRFLNDYEIVAGKKPDLDAGAGAEQMSWGSVEAGMAYCARPEELYIAFKENGESKGNGGANERRIMLEEYTYTVKGKKEFGRFLDMIEKKLPENMLDLGPVRGHTVLMSDDDFAHFVKYSTEVATRIKINPETGTVDGNALFTEEYLPPESLLYSLIFFNKTHLPQKTESGGEVIEAREVRKEFKRLFCGDIFQIGADSTLGKGLVRKRFWEVNEDGKKES